MTPNNKKVFVTGATGYIGGAICIELKKKGYYVVGLDQVYRPHLAEYFDEFIGADFASTHATLRLLEVDPDVIIHCAGTSLVGPSIEDPAKYYHNNVTKTLLFLNNVTNWQKRKPNGLFMFSSSASVYDTDKVLTEDAPKNPISPYAKSKYMVEQILESYEKAYGLRSCVFRYFNACGAVDVIHGQQPEATHIFAKIFETMINKEPFVLNGSDFKTKDGSCIRDYIHVQDIADAHIVAIENNLQGVYNIGMGFGYSNMDCVKVVSDFYNVALSVETGPRRVGDTDSLVADVSYMKAMTGWQAERDIKDVVVSLDRWYNSETFRGYKNGTTYHV